MNLSYDVFKKVFNIKTKIHGYLKNITDDTIEYFDTIGRNHQNKYMYTNQKTIYTIKINQDEIIFTRENDEMSHTMIFTTKKITISEYYLKELHHSLEFNIKTKNMEIIDNQFIINYQILETDNEYEYKIEMSEIK